MLDGGREQLGLAVGVEDFGHGIIPFSTAAVV
jgi:hypothetical protein